jgi:hypothetical protein
LTFQILALNLDFISAFSATSAVKIFKEEWMISQSLVELVEKNAETLAQQWLKDVRENAQTPFYHTFDPDVLRERAINMYKGLGHWLSVETPKEETARFYRKYGQERYPEGFPLPELIYSFILFRRHLWLYILHVGFLDSAYDLLRALELNNRVILFFDRALYNMVTGYEEAQKSKG